jgi:hypothetical protein
MASDWWWGLAFLVGLAAGFQGVYEKFATDAFAALKTAPGFFYLLTRGAVPVGVFYLNKATNVVGGPSWIQALVVGTSSEIVLRSRVYVKKSSNGPQDDILKGPLDLLRFYQNYLLDLACTGVARQRRAFVRKRLPNLPFAPLCQRLRDNLPAWTDTAARAEIETTMNTIATEFALAGSPPAKEDEYRYKLGYAVLNRVGKGAFNTFFG